MKRLRIGWLVLTLLAAGCSRAPRAPVIIDPSLAEFVPADTVSLAGVRLEALRATPLWQKHVAAKPLAPLDELARDTGLDLRKDVADVLVASNSKDVVVLARGRFARAELEAALERRGAKRMPHRGATLIGNEETAVAFLSASVAVAGPAAVVRTVIDQRGRGGVPKALAEEAKGIPADSQIWGVSLGGLGQAAKAAPQGSNLGNLAKFAELVEKTSFGADLRAGLNASGVITCRGEQDARTLSDALRGLVGLGRLSTPDSEPDLLRAFDGIQVSQQQRSVRINAQIAQELMDKLVARFSAGAAALTPGFRLPRLP